MRLVHTPWSKVNRFEWHRVQDRKQFGVRLIGAWWLLLGPLKTLFTVSSAVR